MSYRNSSFFLPFILAASFLITTSFSEAKNEKQAENFEFLHRHFLSPGNSFGTVPLWVWNTKVTKNEIDSMLLDFKKTAFGGVFIHPRPGLITEYLSEDWFDLTSYAVKKGKELGLKMWLYDEDSYPSGFAGGNVQNEMPESFNQGQMLSITKFTVLPDSVSKFFICLKKNGDSFLNITDNFKREIGKKGNYWLFHKEYYKSNGWTAGFPYVDLMVKGVTEKFIDLTLNGYKKNIGNEFGKTIPGVFSDEMTIQAQGAGTIRWTPDLFDRFKQIWKYDLEVNLPSLFEEIGDWKKVRHNYYETLLTLYIERMSKPYSDYAEKNGLIWTGHYYEHSWPNPYHTPDNMAMYAWHQMPGIDMLFNEYNEKGTGSLRETQFGNVRSVRELASVANQLDRKRTLSETYAGCGWELTFKDIKRQGDWEYALGVNFLCQHLADMSIQGSRKYDYPQSFSYQNPWFPYYRDLNEYYARLSFALSQGKQINDVLVLEPTTSAWMYALFGVNNNSMISIGKRFTSFIRTLEKSHAEYDLGSENIILNHGKIVNNRFIIGKRSYSTVIIPPGMENINASTLTLLEQFLVNGGKVLQFEKIQKLNGSSDNRINAFNSAKSCVHLDSLSDEVLSRYFLTGNTKISTFKDSLSGTIYHHRRILDDGQLIFLANVDPKKTGAGEIKIKTGDALLMDPFTGKITDYPESNMPSGKSIQFTIPPAGSLLLFIANSRQTGFEKIEKFSSQKILPALRPIQVKRPAENSLMIDFCDLKFGNTVIKDQFIFNAADTVYKFHGFIKGNPWDHVIQFKNHTLDKNTFEKGSGFTASYHFDVTKEVNLETFRAVIEQADLYSDILINGNKVKPIKGEWWLDRSFSVVKIGQFVKQGLNCLEIIANPMQVLAEIQPVYILGNFDVIPAKKGWSIAPPSELRLGSWKMQGMPLYGYGVSYRKEYNLTDLRSAHSVKLGDWRGTVVVVKVNGKEAGIIASDPYMLDVSKYLCKGNNVIEVEVIGSLKNLLGPHHNSPSPGYVSPASFRQVKEVWSGENYSTLDYGLMNDFQLTESKRVQIN
jgi:hypothetical protein